MEIKDIPDVAVLPARPAPFTIHHEECGVLLKSCFKRIFGWRAPPNWAVVDWRVEMRAHVLAAVCEAICEFDLPRKVPLDAFLYQRVIARAYTRFRQEWTYGLGFISETDEVVTDGGHMSLPGQSRVQYLESSAEPTPYQALHEALESLSEPNHQLIMRLFWEEKTEAAIAAGLGISHQAVSKRKRAVIQKLRARLEEGHQRTSRNYSEDDSSTFLGTTDLRRPSRHSARLPRRFSVRVPNSNDSYKGR